ncbi:hypothetical protein FKW77_005310 [Venturia effusa]|uniref:Uncharacterized protein n=1 Tax=Venturia effusa TaxID=50376 RepID=A0A517LDQ2_9PEZI|nr:hypothetical protein FKW77_005310 [Venturia effusa]
MASPFTSIDNLISLTSNTSSKVLRLIKEWKDAPEQVNFVHEEMEAWRRILHQLQELCTQLNGRNIQALQLYADDISAQLKRIEPEWKQLEEIVLSVTDPLVASVRKDRWMKNAHKVAKLQDRVHKIRFSIMEVLHSCTLAQGLRMETLFEAQHGRSMVRIEARVVNLEHFVSQALMEVKSMRQLPQAPRQQSDEGLLPIFETDQRDRLELIDLPSTPLSTRSWCRPRCSCRCHSRHRRTHLQTAPFKGIAGSYSLMCSGWKMLGQHCDISSCGYGSVQVLEFTYTLPQWSARLSVRATFKMSDGCPSAGLAVEIRIPPDTISRSQSIWGLIGRGASRRELQAFLTKRPDALRHIVYHEGSTMLHVAIRENNPEAVEVLVHAGADPFAEDDAGLPAIVLLLTSRGTRPSILQKQMENILPISQAFEKLDFPHLHQVVMRNQHLDLRSQLERAVRGDVLNQSDSYGWTALHWAAAQADVESVRLLISVGADVNRLNKHGSTPLQRACRAGSEACVDALVTAGADVELARSSQGNPFRYAAKTNPALLSRLIAQGCNVNDTSNIWKSTPLAFAAKFNNIGCCNYLLDHGAILDAQDWEGDTPLGESIGNNSHDALQLLLNRGANLLHKNHRAMTMLHKAGLNADARTCGILSKAMLHGLDPDALDYKGQTAHQYFDSRVGILDDLESAFSALIESIRRANAAPGPVSQVAEDGDSESDDEFVDAEEIVDSSTSENM